MQPLGSPETYSITLTCSLRDLELEAGEEVTIPVLVTNQSPVKLDSDPPHGIFLSYEWVTGDGRTCPDSVYSTAFRPPLGSGETRRVMLRVATPDSVGSYILRIILVQVACSEVIDLFLTGVTVTAIQRRPDAILFRKAMESGDFSRALEHYRRDRVYFGVSAMDEDVSLCRIKTVRDWCTSQSLPYTVLKETGDWSMTPPYRPGRAGPVKYDGRAMLPELYVGEVHDAVVIGGHTPVFLDDRVALIDDNAPKEIRYEDGIVSFEVLEGLLARFWKNPGEHQIPEIREGIFLCGHNAVNYFHWMIQFMPLFWIIDQCPEYDRMPLIISSAVPEKFLAVIRALDTRNREIIPVEYGVRYRVHKLVIPSQFSSSYAGGEIVSPDGVKFLREKLGVNGSPKERKTGRRLYIQRKDPQYRRLLNEHEIEALFRRYGFEFFEPSRISLQEQIQLFSSADILAGPHGAGWTNLLFAPSHARGLMLLGERESRLYSNLAYIIGQDLIHIHGECTREQEIHYQFHCDFVVNVEEIEFALDAVCGEPDECGVKQPSSNRGVSRRLFSGYLPQLNGSTKFNIDLINSTRPGDDAVKITTSLEKKLIIQGWAVDSAGSAPSAAVFITFDTGQEYRAYYGLSRPDVAEHFGDTGFTHTGFISIITIRDLPAGSVSFGIKIVSNDQKGYYYPDERFSFYIVH